MKNKSCLQLLKELQKLSIETISIETLLNLPQELVEKMLKFKDKSQFKVLFYVLRHSYCYGLNYILKCADIVIDGINPWNVEWVQGVLCNDCAIQNGIAIEGAKLIKENKSSFQVDNIGAVLCNQNIIETGMALEGAKLLLQTQNEIQAECIYHVLCNPNTIEIGIAIKGSKLILQAQDDCKSRSICKLLCSVNKENIKLVLKGAELLLEAKNWEEEQHIIYNILMQMQEIKEQEIQEIYDENVSKLITDIEAYSSTNDSKDIDYSSYQKYLQKYWFQKRN